MKKFLNFIISYLTWEYESQKHLNDAISKRKQIK